VSSTSASPARGGFLDFLNENDRSDLDGLGRLQRYARGAWIMRQGDPSDSVAIILEGRAKITLDTADGRVILLDVFGPGEVVGEFEAFGGYASRAAGVVALDAVVCRTLTRAQFLDYLMAHPAGAIGLVRMMIRRLGAADRRRISGTSMNASYALARFLIELADGYGPADASAIELDLPLAQHELASLIGVSRNSIVRALSTLRSRRLVATGQGTIRVLDADALRQYADPMRR
jgi:CRP-like cAMP-binding protein